MLYQEVLDQCPSHWTKMDCMTKYALVKLKRHTSEYRKQARKFGLTQGEDIYRIQNPLLYGKFLHRKHDFQMKHSTTPEVVSVYHDTAEILASSICECNLDWRLGERNKYGPGVYFSKRPQDAMRHSNKKLGPFRAMFMVDLLVGKTLVVDGEVFLPPPGYDTVMAHNGQTYIKYFDNSEFYPSYVTYYFSTIIQ